MDRGVFNYGRLRRMLAMKPRVGKTSASRRRLGRCVSKARRRALRMRALMEWNEEGRA